jgi:UDP:flavonoid glycosyltransferase YjiC (YdhE family)
VVLRVEASPTELRGAIESVLDEPTYRAAAQRFGAEYDPTASVAIEEVEALG